MMIKIKPFKIILFLLLPLVSIAQKNPVELGDVHWLRSMEEAQAGSARKWKNLGKGSGSARTPLLNFGGRSAELVCAGVEAGFVRRMIEESALMPERCRWFTSLVAKAENLRAIESALNTAGVRARRTIEMAQGQKKSRIVAWTYLSLREQQAWRSGARGG